MFGDKLKKARISAKLKQSDLAKILDTTNTTISNWENNVSKPDVDTIEYICGALNVPASYFFNTPDSVTPILTITEQAHIKKYRTLDEHGKKCERVEATRTPVIPISNIITLSEFEQPVSAGKGVYLGDGSQTITREVPNTEETRKADFILRVSGDSMEPKYSDGDRLLIKRQHDVNVGEEGIFILNNEGFVKKRETDRLVSLNPVYEDIFFRDEDSIECKGKVIGKIQIDQAKPVDHPQKKDSDKQKETVTIGIAARDGSSSLELTKEQYEKLVELAKKGGRKELPDGII